MLAGAALSGCGSDGSDKPEAKPLRRCEVPETGMTFRTSLPTCAKALAKGLSLSLDAGVITDPDVVGAGVAFAALCQTMQGTEKIPYDDAQGVGLAKALNRTGVCPGKVSNFDATP